MRTQTLVHALMAGLATILCAGMLSPGVAADPLDYLEIIEMPPAFDSIPAIWEHLVQEGTIEWTEENEGSTEPNDDATQACQVSSGIRINGNADELLDPNDYYKVVLTERSSLFVRLTWTGAAWLNVYIYDANLGPITYLNENTPSPKVLSIWQYNSGTYYVRVRAASGGSDYQLGFAIAGQTAEPQNDTLEDSDLTVSADTTALTSVICSSADPVDYAMLSIPEGDEAATITLDWFGSQNSNLDLDIYSVDGERLYTVNDSSTFESHFSPNVPPGDYYIAVRSVSGRAMYQLMVNSEVDTIIDIPLIEMAVAPWHPPYDEDDFDIVEAIIGIGMELF